MKKVIIWVVIIIIVAVGILWYNNAKKSNLPDASTAEKIKIGAILPLTGPIASAGEFAKHGIELAMSDLKKENNLNIEVIFEDGQYDAKVSLAAYKKLKTINDIKSLIVFGSPTAMALTPVINADKMPMLALTASPAYSTPDDYAYRIVGHADSEAKFASDVLVDKLGKKKIAVIYLNNDYGSGALSSFKKYIAGRATVVAEEGSAPGTTDFRGQLAKIKAARPDAFFMATLYKEGGLILKQAKEIGLTGTFMCGQPCDVQELITTGGPATDGLIVVSSTDKGDPGFIERYQNSFGNKPGYLSFRHYDATKILNFVLPKCADTGYAGECLKKEIDSLKDFPGLSYPINFDQNGDINDQFILKIIKNGVYEPYE